MYSTRQTEPQNEAKNRSPFKRLVPNVPSSHINFSSYVMGRPPNVCTPTMRYNYVSLPHWNLQPVAPSHQILFRYPILDPGTCIASIDSFQPPEGAYHTQSGIICLNPRANSALPIPLHSAPSGLIVPKCSSNNSLPLHSTLGIPSQVYNRPFTLQSSYARVKSGSMQDTKRRYSRSFVKNFKPKDKKELPSSPFTGSVPCGRKSHNTVYTPHLSAKDMYAGLESGELLSGSLAMRSGNFGDSYVKHPLGDADIYIPTFIARNRALPNDIVAVKVRCKREWRIFDAYVDESLFKELKTRQGEPKYVTVKYLLENKPGTLKQLLGPEVTDFFTNDLETSNDPPDQPNQEGSVISYPPWWTIVQRTGDVVGILHKLHPRVCMGYIRILTKDASNKQGKNSESETPNKSTEQSDNPTNGPENSDWLKAVLYPTDVRVPRITILRSDCPEEFIRNPSSFKHVRCVAGITMWSHTHSHPVGKLIRTVSSDCSNLIETETERILIGCGFLFGLDNANKFPDEVIQEVQDTTSKFSLAMSQELAYRRDFRRECVFTIDPSTARDLDDALHIRDLTPEEIKSYEAKGFKDAFYEVGVHIADVSYFVRPNSEVDREAACRATSIYLVQVCIPMLPTLLCEEMCSLNPGEDRFAFSVVFIVTKKAQILTSWFGRTIIRSCSKLSYEDAQCLIEDRQEDTKITVEKPHSMKTIYENVRKLNSLASIMRRCRFSSGALILNQVRITFALDDEKKMPLGVTPSQYQDSNWLIEEWMLAANHAVAKRLANRLPKMAFLRRHPPPSMRLLLEASAKLTVAGIDVNVDSAGAIQASICREAGCPVEVGYRYPNDLASLCQGITLQSGVFETTLAAKLEALDLEPVFDLKQSRAQQLLAHEAQLLVTVSVLTKTMNLALYFCLGRLGQGTSPKHYALNMDWYTHFTSPIRRYADIIVHRQLAQTLADDAEQNGDAALSAWYSSTVLPKNTTKHTLQSQAEVCNSKKLTARLASDESAELFWTLFVKENGPLTEICAVTHVLERAFDVLILSCGVTKRVYLNNLNLRTSEFISPRLAMGKVVEFGKLCLLWDPNPADNGQINSGDQKSKSQGEIFINATEPSCGCFYQEIKFLSLVQCSVAIAPEDNPANASLTTAGNNDEEQTTAPVDTLPKIRVTLIRPSCPSCQHF